MKNLAAVIWLLLFCGSALSQAYPNRPVRVVVPYPPGGGADTLARTVGQKLGEIGRAHV